MAMKGIKEGQPDLYYVSTIRGLAEEAGASSAVYYGFVCRVPKDAWDAADLNQMNPYLEDQLKKVGAYLSSLSGDDVAGSPVERYEVYDIESDDILVMYRIPVLSLEFERAALKSTTVH